MLLDLFNTCVTKQGYVQTRWKVDWKIVDGKMYFRQSCEGLDWIRNVLAVFPIPARLAGKWVLMPLGAWLTWIEVRKIALTANVIEFIGYSQGAWPAAYASAETGKLANVFGCPNLILGDVTLFDHVTFHQTPCDIVTKLPAWAKKGRNVMRLCMPATKPIDMSDTEWLTGHTLAEYRQRMK